MKKTLIILFLLFSMGGYAQVFPVQVNAQLVPPYSPYLSDYTTPGVQNFMVQVRANDLALSGYPFKLRITIEGVGISLRTKQNLTPSPLILEGSGITQILYGEDLQEYFHPDALDFAGFTRSDYEKSARLPEGVYRFTVEVLDYNRGTVVSNKGIAMAWVILNDPPLLNLPANLSKLKVRDPVNILFHWTPRHSGSPNAAFTTEYIFRMVEIWPEDRNPYDAFITQPPIYETITTQNQIVYGLSEPALTGGRKYAWQVEARDTGGKDLFKNKGRSEVFVFRFGDALAIPENLQLRWAKPTTLAIRWGAVKVADTEEVKYRLAYRLRKRTPDHRWYETRTKFTDKTLYDLQPNTEYEFKVRTETEAQEGEYSEIQVFKTLAQEKDAFVCRDAGPPPLPENTLPVFPLGINDTIRAGGYDVLVRDVIEVEGKYFGSGFAIVPWLNSAKVRVTFERIRVNDRFWLTSGIIKSVWNAESPFLIEEQKPILPGSAPQAGELDVTIVSSDSLITIEGAVQGTAIATVTKDEEGNIVITTTDGGEQTLDRGVSYAIVDDVGNGYVVDKAGNIAKTTSTEARATAARGDRDYDLAVRFARGHGRYGFDEKKFEALARYYQQLEGGLYVGWKALSSSAPDAIDGHLRSGDTDIRSVRFEAGAVPIAPVSAPGGKVTLNVQGKAAGLEEELLALYKPADSLPGKIVGKINLVTYDPIRYNLVIVPVNDASIPGGLSAYVISGSLNNVFNQAVVEWKVSIADRIRVALGETFDDGETGVFSNYTDDMKKVLNAWGRFEENTYYLFLIDEPRNMASLGYMPRGRQAGFVFVAPHQGNTEEFLKTLAHELGHGAFNLKHTFSEHNLPANTTDNLMDYSSGTALYKYQWDHIHQPQGVMGLFEGSEGGMVLEAEKFESDFLIRIGDTFKWSPCLTEAIEKGRHVAKKYNTELAYYTGFLRLMLCETEKERCEQNEKLDPFTCGLTNGLLQEIDWITIIESVQEWSVDPEKILLCILHSYPVNGVREDNPPLEPIIFKCLVGIEIDHLTASIKDFVISNWDDPYYQGQATAFALTLLGPFKGKILTRLEKIPQFSSRLDNFKALAKAGNRVELVGISRLLANLVDDIELEKVAKAIKYLPGPELPRKIAATFTNSIYKNRKLLQPERYFKYHGINNRTGMKYTWLVDKKYPAETELRTGLAIRDDWNVDIKYVSEFEVPAGTWVSEGKAASQGIEYSGGEYQAIILNVPKTWILKTTDAF